MTDPSAPPLPLPAALPERVQRPEQILRRLFLTLFLRGRTSRGLNRSFAPKSVGTKLSTTLGAYAATGLLACMFIRQPVMALSIYLHGMTFIFLGMFVAASAGEVLFNKDEAEILLHRPISPRALLWSKVRVLVEVSLWLAGAFNLAGFFVGLTAPGGGWQFPIVHAVSTLLEALFCTSAIVLVYQLCLRWFGRERLDGLMTSAQVIVVIAAVLSSQILPRIMSQLDSLIDFSARSWWIALLPPAWFAGFDDAFSGSGSTSSFVLAGLGVAATAVVLALAFGKLAGDYQSGLQAISETVSKRRSRPNRRRWIDVLVNSPPLSWWLRDPVERAGFLLTSAYMARDRDVKLRLYPGIAPMLALPIILLLPNYGPHGSQSSAVGNIFIIAFMGNYIGIVPMLGLSVLQYSQQWQASDLFRAAPMVGPAGICHGARRAVLLFLTFPLLVILAAIAGHAGRSHVLLLFPGVIALPVFALLPHLGGHGVPLSVAAEEANSAGRAIFMFVAMGISAGLSGLAYWAWIAGWYGWFLLGEALVAGIVYALLRRSISRAHWSSME
jgi:hypothetical protein